MREARWATDRADTQRKLDGALAAEAPVVAGRLSYLAKTGDSAVLGSRDLVKDVKEGTVELEALPARQLPERLRELAEDERGAWLQQQIDRREALQRRIGTLVAERDAWYRAYEERRSAEGEAAGFDRRVLETIRSQAAEKGIRYE